MLLHIEESAEMVGLISQRAVSPFPVSSFEESRLRFPVHDDSGTSGPQMYSHAREGHGAF